jgi:hypothetical protein
VISSEVKKRRFECVRLVNDSGHVDWFRKVTRVGLHGGDRLEAVTTLLGDALRIVGDGVFESDGVRWRLTR